MIGLSIFQKYNFIFMLMTIYECVLYMYIITYILLLLFNVYFYFTIKNFYVGGFRVCCAGACGSWYFKKGTPHGSCIFLLYAGVKVPNDVLEECC